MDTLQTAVGKEDAVQKDLVESNADSKSVPAVTIGGGPCGDGSVENLKQASTDEPIVSSASLDAKVASADASVPDNDDLLEKIEEAVSTESNGNAQVDVAIAESSEQDFLKKLEEAEAEATAESNGDETANIVDPIVENVSSSDEKDKVGIAAGAAAATDSDEPDRVAHREENVADSTSIESSTKSVNKIATEKLEDITEIISSEEEDDDAIRSNIEVKRGDIPAPSRNTFSADDISESGEDVAELGKVGGMENGEVAESMPEIIDLDDTPAQLQQSSEVEPIKPVESVDLCLDDDDDDCQVVKESGTKEDERPVVSQSSSIVEKIVQPEEQPMSTDPSPAAETMDVDEEEKMDVDAVETISDNEEDMTPIPEVTEKSDQEPVVEKAPTVVEPVAPEAATEIVEKEKPIELKEKSSPVPKIVIKTADETGKPSEVARPENKLLTTIKHADSITSLENSPVAAAGANVFNSTPIQKQFEISSENVSKISDAHESVSRTTEEAAQLSKTGEESTAASSTSDSTPQSSADTVTKFVNAIKDQCNGTSEESDATKTSSSSPKSTQTKESNSTPSESAVSTSDASHHKTHTYEVNVWYEEDDIRFLSIEHTIATPDSSEKLSSNGSVTSLPPFPLPNRISEAWHSASSSGSQKTTADKSTPAAHTKRSKHTIIGTAELCTFMIDQFTKIRNKIEPPKETAESIEQLTATPRGRGRVAASSAKKLTSGRKPKSISPQVHDEDTSPKRAATDKRASVKRTLNDTDEDIPAAKQTKSELEPEPEDDSAFNSVLAKWVDKKYYAGKVVEERSGNKFVVLFEDGASKVLPKESIVFGEGDRLPLQDQSVYALVDDDYELTVVKAIDKPEGERKVRYTVDIKGKEIIVSASDIYLTDQQAKTIQNLRSGLEAISSAGGGSGGDGVATITSSADSKSPHTSRSTRKRQAASPLSPEAGFSGGLPKRAAGRKGKRLRNELTRISESTDLSDSPDILQPPPSPDSGALEHVEGVQPELQRTTKEIEICRMIMISDLQKSDPTCDIQGLLGPMPQSKSLFKNKCFLLTCTITQKLPQIVGSESSFCQIPFIKQHLQQQIEMGGGKVYHHFEDVPKSKYRQCKLIASSPCTTAKYIQCLAADIHAISHDWIIQGCRTNTLSDIKKYHLPSGWSIVNKKYIRWSLGKSADNRTSSKPLQNVSILIDSINEDFKKFWSRVCKLAGATTIRYVKSLNDITPTTRGFLIIESDFPQAIKSKAEHYGVTIVSTTWLVQSLIVGQICDPIGHRKFLQFCHDDDDED